MKADVGYIGADSHRNTKGLDGAIEVLVIDRVFIMPDAGGRICHLVANEANAIDSWSRLDLVDGRSGPRFNGRLHLDRGRGGRKGETSGASDSENAVGDIIVLVALGWIRLAPEVFMWSDVLTFGKVGRARILSRIQITYIYRHSV